MNAIVQLMTKWRRQWLLLSIGFLLGGHSVIWAQCPAGWTSVASGTIYPDTATGGIYAGSPNNVIYGGADGQVVQVNTGSNIVFTFNQTLTAGGTLNLVAGAIPGYGSGSFNVTFSTDGITYTNSTGVTIAASATTLTSYPITVPVGFKYVKIAPLASSYTNIDAVGYQGAYCQEPMVSYASCGSGQSQVRRVVYGISTAGSSNVLQGPDGLKADLTTSTQAVTVKFAKAWAANDTIQVTGFKYVSTQVGDFTVQTSLDGANFTTLPSSAFTNNPTVLQTIKIAATSAFQYVKVVPSGFGQVSVDAITVFGQTCITTPTACASGSTEVANGIAYPISASGTIAAGYLNNAIYGGADGQTATLYASQAMVLTFDQTLAAGGELEVVAARALSTLPGSFNVTFSNDGINYSNSTLITIPASVTNLQAYKMLVPTDFKYVKITPVVSPNNHTNIDAVNYQGRYCKFPVANYATCATGESQVTTLIEGESAAGTDGLAPENVVKGPNGVEVNLTTTAQAVIVKFTQGLAIGDTIKIIGYQYVSTQVGTFQVLTSADGANFTPVQTTAFTGASALQTISVVATLAFRYVKVVASGFGQVKLASIAVMGKSCFPSSGSCNLAYSPIAGQSAKGEVYSRLASDVLIEDGLVTELANSTNYVSVNFGQSIPANSDVYIKAASGSVVGSFYPGDFYVYSSSDGINYSLQGTVIVPTKRDYEIYRVRIPVAFQYIKVALVFAPTARFVFLDYIGAAAPVCAPCLVTGTVGVVQATCAANGGSNSDAQLLLNSYSGGATRVGYSTGSSYTGSAYSAATAVNITPMTLATGLANPASLQPYTVRVFKDASCYKDFVVTLDPKVCLTADLSLTASPPTKSGNKGEQVTYTFTLTNAGPDAAPTVTASIPLPGNTTFLSATASQGTYNSGTAIWDLGTVPVGSQTITLTLQIK